jgi:predicted ArsR family transcriptional regulator
LKQTGFVQNLGRTRTRVLEELRAAGSAVAVASVARRLGLHVNTARFHLDALAAAGLAERSVEESSGAGRPRVLYAATADSAGLGRRSYRVLAEVLAGHLATRARRPDVSALAAGREWGRSLAPRPAPLERVSADAAVRALLDVLGGIGFLPEVVPDAGGTQVRLHHCPFREVAAAHGQVVCSLHLGLMQGLLGGLGAPVAADLIEPFRAPTWCAVRLRPSGG